MAPWGMLADLHWQQSLHRPATEVSEFFTSMRRACNTRLTPGALTLQSLAQARGHCNLHHSHAGEDSQLLVEHRRRSLIFSPYPEPRAHASEAGQGLRKSSAHLQVDGHGPQIVWRHSEAQLEDAAVLVVALFHPQRTHGGRTRDIEGCGRQRCNTVGEGQRDQLRR